MASVEDAGADRICLEIRSARLNQYAILFQWLLHLGQSATGASYGSQLELQAINARGWLLTKAAEPATSKPTTTVNARNFIIDQIESPWILNLNLHMVGGGNENGHGQQYGFPVAVVGRDVQRSAQLRALHSYSDIADGNPIAL
jgi:hypothetical protein